jgi:hypothetical protein
VVDEDWVVLAEHLLSLGSAPIDGTGVELLYFEALLRDNGIDAAFDPFRPGEGGGFTRNFLQPVRLLVKACDLERAQALVAEVEQANPERSSDAHRTSAST